MRVMAGTSTGLAQLSTDGPDDDDEDTFLRCGTAHRLQVRAKAIRFFVFFFFVLFFVGLAVFSCTRLYMWFVDYLFSLPPFPLRVRRTRYGARYTAAVAAAAVHSIIIIIIYFVFHGAGTEHVM